MHDRFLQKYGDYYEDFLKENGEGEPVSIWDKKWSDEPVVAGSLGDGIAKGVTAVLCTAPPVALGAVLVIGFGLAVCWLCEDT